jgi:hypothetical protein
VRLERVVCREAVDAADPMIRAAGRLYEQTLDPGERIPWEWIEGAVWRRQRGEASNWNGHLLLAEGDPDGLAGYAYGSFIRGYGGYLCYVGVADWARRLGVGTKLFTEFFKVLDADATAAGEPLPFVVWESHRPEADDPAGRDLWAARVRLFDRVGGLWVEGVDFYAPNYEDRSDDPVPMQLFVKPVGLSAADLAGERLRDVVDRLHRRLYGGKPGDPLYDRTLPPTARPRLRPARAAGEVRSGAVLV